MTLEKQRKGYAAAINVLVFGTDPTIRAEARRILDAVHEGTGTTTDDVLREVIRESLK